MASRFWMRKKPNRKAACPEAAGGSAQGRRWAMSLKDQLAADIDRVFFTDFTTEHKWNDSTIHVIADRDQELKLKGGVLLGDMENGVNEFLIHVPATDFAKRPGRNDYVFYDGLPCVVQDVGENEGVYEILLSAQKGRRA
jgi:hypothetical protein